MNKGSSPEVVCVNKLHIILYFHKVWTISSPYTTHRVEDAFSLIHYYKLLPVIKQTKTAQVVSEGSKSVLLASLLISMTNY